MNEIHIFGFLNWKLNTVPVRLFSFFFLYILIVSSCKTKSNQNASYHYDSELFHKDLTQKEENDFNSTSKLVCFYVFTTAFNSDIMDRLCTHIIVGFFGVNNNTFKLEVSSDQEQILTKVLLLKEKFKDLKIIISVGGANAVNFSSVVSRHTSRKIFIKSCMEFVKRFKLDGIDLDWEWPVVNNGNTKEKVKFVQLLREIRQEFDRHKKKYILSADVPSNQEIIELGYYVKYISYFVDFVNIMCYDYHYFTKFFPFTGHNAPLYSNKNYFLWKSNINYSVSFWISSGMPREKIVLGIPTYGHSFELIFSDHHSVLSPAKGFGSLGHGGFADYGEICQFLKNKNTKVVYDAISKTPYAYRFQEWVSFDNEGSIATKASFVLEQKLAGAMIFSVNADDFTGSCKGDNIPLPLIRKMSGEQETVTCPYNLSHQILKARMPKHLIKCRKQHPISFFETCPFNTTHDVPETEFEYHIKTCPDRRKLDNYLYVIGDSKPNDIPINVEIPPSVENWDEEEVQSVSYVDCKDRHLENKMIIRTPVGLTKAQRKAFFQDEVLRLQRVSSSLKSNNAGKPTSSVTKYPAVKKVKHSTTD